MTCIIGYVGPDADWIAGDRELSFSNMRCQAAEAKVWESTNREGLRLIGCSGSSAAIEHLRELSTDRGFPGSLLLLVTDAMGKVQGAKDGWSALALDRGRIFAMGDGRVSALDETSWAIGSGAEVALGAFRVAIDFMPPEKALRLALEHSARLCDGVRGPFDVLCVLRAEKGDGS